MTPFDCCLSIAPCGPSPRTHEVILTVRDGQAIEGQAYGGTCDTLHLELFSWPRRMADVLALRILADVFLDLRDDEDRDADDAVERRVELGPWLRYHLGDDRAAAAEAALTRSDAEDHETEVAPTPGTAPPASYRPLQSWRLEVTEWQTLADGGVESFVRLASVDHGVEVSGWILHHAGESPMMADVMRNDAFLPPVVLRRLLLKLDDVYWPRVGAFGDGGVSTLVAIEDFVHEHFVDGPGRILSLLLRPVRTFFSPTWEQQP